MTQFFEDSSSHAADDRQGDQAQDCQSSDGKDTKLQVDSNKETERVSWSQRLWLMTGFSQRTLFDWLEVIAVPLIVGLASIGLAVQQMVISQDNQRSEVMSKYYERMQELIIEEKMGDPQADPKVRSMGSALTLSTFRQLDGERKGELLKFLYQAKLLNKECISESSCSAVIDLDNARLEGTKFSPNDVIQLIGIDLEKASLEGATLPGIQLTKAYMNRINLKRANLSQAFLNEAQMQYALLKEANLTDANLFKTDMSFALLEGAKLIRASLKGADLRCAELQKADLSEAKLADAKLKNAKYDSLTNFPEGFTDTDATNAGMIKVKSGETKKEVCRIE